MKILALANLIVFLIVYVISVFIGFDPKKWPSWLLGLYVFFSGSLTGFLRDGGSFDILMGLIFVLVVLSSGVVTRWQRQYYGKKAEPWLRQHGQEKQFSLLARMIRRMLNK